MGGRDSARASRKAQGHLPRWLPLALLVAAGVPAALLWFAGAENPGGSGPPLVPDAAAADAPGPPPRPVDLDPGALPDLPGTGALLVELRWLGAEEEQPLQQVRGGVLQGRVITPEGEALPGARIRIRGGPQDGLTTLAGPDGGYWLPGLVPGLHLLEVEARGIRVVRSQRVRGRGTTRRDLILGEAVPLAVLVRDAEGRPLAGARVRADLDGEEAVTGEDGVARLAGVIRGPRVLVDVLAEGHVPTRHELNLLPPPPADGSPVELPPLERGGVVAGQVATWPGGPLPRIVVVPRADRPGPTQVVWETWDGVEVDASGFFRLENLPTTRMVDIRAFHPGGVCQPPLRTVRADPHHTVAVRFIIRGDDGRRIAGRVLGPDGRPLAGARVVLEARDPAAVLGALYPGLSEGPVAVRLPVPAPLRRELVTGPDGRFDFAWGDHPEGAGTLLLTASKEGYEPRRVEVRVVRSSFTLRLDPERRDGRIRLERAGGAPLPEAVEWRLDGERLEEPQRLRRGLYQVQVRRGGRILHQEDALRVGPDTVLTLP